MIALCLLSTVALLCLVLSTCLSVCFACLSGTYVRSTYTCTCVRGHVNAFVCMYEGIWKVLSMVIYLSNRFINPVMFVTILKSYFSSMYMAQISRGYYNADTKNIIVNTCSVYILENTKFHWEI